MEIVLGIFIGLAVILAGLLFTAAMLWRVERRKGREGLVREDRLLKAVDQLKAALAETQVNPELEERYHVLTAQVEDLEALRTNLNHQLELTKLELSGAEIQISSAKTQFTDWTEAAKKVHEELEAQEKKLGELRANGEAAITEELAKRRAETEALVGAEAEARRAEASKELTELLAELEKKVAAGTEEYEDLRQKLAARRAEYEALAVSHAEAVRRQALESGEGGGHIELAEADREEVALIKKMCKGLRCENAVLKATYDVYVKPEIERLVKEAGVAGVSGIYRIWRKDGEKEVSYIGQAVDVGERWKTHAKRAWGIDDTGRIVLYQEMMRTGIENWYWELVEAVAADGSGSVATMLSEREKYWGGFYAVKEIGLNKKLG